MSAWLVSGLALIAVGATLGAAWRVARARHVGRWLGPLLAHCWGHRRNRPAPGSEVHLILAIADHFEPDWGGASDEVARSRVASWVRDYPRVLGDFRDTDGRPPRHTFFYPVEVYDESLVEGIAGLCRAGFGEVEVHLHHDGDTSESLRATLETAVRRLSENHGLLSRDRRTGALGYAFVHGNWALNNARPDGRWCGVNDEIAVLKATGCYADLTFPSAPSPTQPRTVNQLYYATGDPARPCGHDRGTPVGAGPPPAGSLLMIPGPLGLNWRRRKWGLLPRLENGCVQASQPASVARLPAWLGASVRVPARPDWFFVKLHAHGATEHDRPALLGEPMAQFHRDLARRAAADTHFHYHYVTAREMYNLVRAAEAGWAGSVEGARDFERVGPGLWGGPTDGPGLLNQPTRASNESPARRAGG